MNVPTDRTPTVAQQDTNSHDGTRQDATVGVAEAAHLLGMTTDAVRARVRRGTLQGHKVDGEWQVIVPASTVAQQGATEHQQDATADRQEADRTPTIDLSPLVSHIATLEEQVQRLTEATAMWQTRAAHLDNQLKQLTAGNMASENAPEAVESPQTNETESHGFWDRVRRFWSG